jgi:FkbM family methyltransferase
VSPAGPTGIAYVSDEPEPVHSYMWSQFGGDLAFDVGANTGQSARAMLAGRFSRVVACEPAIESFTSLAREHGADPRVTLLHTAVGETDGELELSVCPHAIANGHLLSPALIGRSPHPFFRDEQGRRTVPCVTLDTLAARYGMPGLVKVDTEGSEVLVLRGARSLMEWHSPALQEACRELLDGYRQEVINYPEGDHPPYEGEPQCGWLLALPEVR